MRRPLMGSAAGLLLAGLMGACGGSDMGAGDGAEVQPTERETVRVRLVDFEVQPKPDTVTAGTITFDVKNDGYATDEDGEPIPSISAGRHNLYVLRTDLPAGDLPQITIQFIVDLEAPGIEVVDSVPQLEAGVSDSLTVDLGPGAYVLICNLQSHYARGMWAKLSVG